VLNWVEPACSYYVVLPLSCLPMASFADWKYTSDRQPESISMWTTLGLMALKQRHQLVSSSNAMSKMRRMTTSL